MPSEPVDAAREAGGRSLAGTQFDPRELARRGGQIDGVVPVAAMGRLFDQLAGQAGSLAVRIDGFCDNRRRPWLRLAVRGDLELVCQRCLQPVAQAVGIEVELRVVPPGDPVAADEQEDEEVIEAGEALSLLELVEEEVILDLPFAPAHAACELPGKGTMQGAQSPFAALKVLKQH